MVGAAAILATLMGGGAMAANATITYPEGGTFSYGTDDPSRGTWSDYYHSSRAHYSTAINASYSVRSANAAAGVWSRASIGTTLYGNRALYDFL